MLSCEQAKGEKPTFSLLSFKETVETQSGVEKRNRGEMMWYRKWLDWATSVSGGSKTMEQAESQWKIWCVSLRCLLSLP